jgi:hypothetical protein
LQALAHFGGGQQIDAAELIVFAEIAPGGPWRANLPSFPHAFASFVLDMIKAKKFTQG